jgi:DNA-binding beta-propeller fold protein YncE
VRSARAQSFDTASVASVAGEEQQEEEQEEQEQGRQAVEESTEQQAKHQGEEGRAKEAEVERHVNLEKFFRALAPSPKPEWRIGDGSDGHADHQLNDSCGIAFVPSHCELVVATSFASNQVRVYHRRKQRLLCKLGLDDGRPGVAAGKFSRPWGVAISSDGKFVVVSEQGNDRLQVLQLNAAPDGSRAQLQYIRMIGGGIDGTGTEPGQLKDPRGLAMRKANGRETVLVAEHANHRVSEFKLDGTFVGVYGEGRGSGEGQLKNPIGIVALPSPGEFAVTEAGNFRVTIFTPIAYRILSPGKGHPPLSPGKGHPPLSPGKDGNTVGVEQVEQERRSKTVARSFGGKGKGDGEFMKPDCIVSDVFGNLAVLDKATNRLQVFSTDGGHLLTRTDLGINSADNKGMAWSHDEGCIAIANGSADAAMLWGGGPSAVAQCS